MSKPFTADTGDFTTTNVTTANETTANIGTSNETIANITTANLHVQALLAAISPADIGGTTQNDYSPAGLATTGIINLNASSAAIITGFDASVVATGRLIYLYALPTNVGNITINNEDAGSLAANRIDLPGAAPAVMTPGSALALRYDGGSARWRALSSTSSTQLPSLIVTGPVTFSGVISPASLAANVNNYNPAGLATCATVRQAVNAGVQATITGLTAQGTGGRRITFQNLGSGSLLFSSEDANSTAANRFSMPGAATWELLTDGAITFLYDGATSRWIAENTTQCTPFLQVNATASPAAITGTQNDYNPTGLATNGIIRQALSGASILTGIVAQSDGRLLILENLDTTLTLTLNNEDTGSAAANRFTLPGAAPLIVNQGGCVVLIYDGTSSRWRTIGQIGATVPIAGTSDGIFSDGKDGNVVFDGVSTVLGLVPSAGVYTLTRTIRPFNCQVNVGVVINTAGWLGLVKNTTTNNGRIISNGGNGGNGGATNAAGSAGAAAISGTTLLKSTNGGGLGGTTGAATGGTGFNNTIDGMAGTGGAGGTPGGGNATGVGAGGGGGGGNGNGGGGGTQTLHSSPGIGSITTMMLHTLSPGGGSAPTQFNLGGAGGGGGSGAAAGGGGGGGGGAGGGCVVWQSRFIIGTGTFEANAGNGGNGFASGNTGGGGGGGGGVIILSTTTSIFTTTNQVNHGTGGTANGTGTHGGNGTDGLVFILN